MRTNAKSKRLRVVEFMIEKSHNESAEVNVVRNSCFAFNIRVYNSIAAPVPPFASATTRILELVRYCVKVKHERN